MSVQDQTEYEDLLGLWSDLEAGLGVLLGSPSSIQEFEPRIWQYDRWMQTLLERDADIGLYLLFQLATHSSVGYSASHALICSVLCHLIAGELKLDAGERDSLVHASMTMNIGMTTLQDALALQTAPLSAEQQAAIHAHPAQGSAMLTSLGVSDRLWLDVVQHHHDDAPDKTELRLQPAVQRLVSILRVVDRYAAMISPRKSREGRSTTESVRSIMSSATSYNDAVGHALVRAVGLCPPGTYVRLADNTIAVVVRRSSKTNQPYVAILTDGSGAVLARPLLHCPAQGRPAMKSALATALVRQRFNHHRVLQLSTQVPQAQRT